MLNKTVVPSIYRSSCRLLPILSPSITINAVTFHHSTRLTPSQHTPPSLFRPTRPSRMPARMLLVPIILFTYFPRTPIIKMHAITRPPSAMHASNTTKTTPNPTNSTLKKPTKISSSTAKQCLLHRFNEDDGEWRQTRRPQQNAIV